MYNGIGLPSVRGTATSGHVQSNRAYVRPSSVRVRTSQHRKQQHNETNNKHQSTTKKQNKIAIKNNNEINEHEEKRKFENYILELRIHLEDDGLPEHEIEKRVQHERARYNARSTTRNEDDEGDDKIKINDPYKKMIKDNDNNRMKHALRIRDTHKVGNSFNRELQLKEQEERRARYEEEQLRKLEDDKKKEDELEHGEILELGDFPQNKSKRGRSRSISSRSSKSSRSYSSSSSSRSSNSSYSSSSSSSGSSHSSKRRNSSNKKRHHRRRCDSSSDSSQSSSSRHRSSKRERRSS